MYLSYSGLKEYLECPRAYWHKYVDHTPPSKQPNRVHMLYGDSVGRLFEAFYNERLWSAPDPVEVLLERVDATIANVIQDETKKGGQFDWADLELKRGGRTLEEITTNVRQTVPRGIASIRHHKLIGVEAKAEVVLNSRVNGHTLAGRADFVLRRHAGDLVLVDGKGSTWRDAYVNHRQLRWYALLHLLKFGVLPDRVGFLFWRSEPDESMDWSEVTLTEVDELKRATLNVIDRIEAGQRSLGPTWESGRSPGMVFWVNPGQRCKLCSYLPRCAEAKTVLAAKAPTYGVEDEDIGL